MYQLNSNDESKKDLPQPLEMPWWDYEKNQVIKTATYKLIGFLQHNGISVGGHYDAHIYFGSHGWYRQDDTYIIPAIPEFSIATRKLVALYELQE